MQEILSLFGILASIIVTILQKPPPPTRTKIYVIYYIVIDDPQGTPSQDIPPGQPSVTEKT